MAGIIAGSVQPRRADLFLARAASPAGIYSISGDRKWFVIYTEPNHERKVAEELDDLEIENFLPIKTEFRDKTRSERDRKAPPERVSIPLLSRYLFVDLPDAAKAFGIVQGLKGVVEILGHGEVKSAVPRELVTHLRERQLAGAFDFTIKRRRGDRPEWLKRGEVVRISDGPFASFSGIIERCLPRGEVELAIKIFGRATIAKLEITQVEQMR